MDLAEKLSKKCTSFIGTNLEKSPTELEQIQYGIHVILINLFKIFILFITAYFLGVFNYTLIAFLSFAILRCFASGIHASSSLKCIIVNYIIFLGNTYLSLYLTLNRYIVCTFFIISLLLLIKYAPADTDERPLVSKKLRKKLKLQSIFVIIFFFAITLLLKNLIWVSLISYSVLMESLLITPFIYRLFGKEYNNYEKYQC